MKITTLIVVALLCLNFKAHTQSQILQIGDQIPQSVQNNTFKYFSKGAPSSQKLKFSDSKVTILDFWATWCAPCVQDLSPQHELVTSYGGKVQLIHISQEKLSTINSFFLSKRNTLGKQFSTVFEDSLLTEMFPHRFIPHLVWIMDNKVVAITAGNELTKNKADSLLAGKYTGAPKVDMLRNVPAFMNSLPSQLIAGNLLFHGKAPGLNSGHERRSSAKLTGILIKNLPIAEIYTTSLNGLYPWFHPKRLLIDSTIFERFKNPKYNPDELWTIDFWVPKSIEDSLSRNMLEFLNQYSGFYLSPTERETLCLIATYNTKKQKQEIKTQGGQTENSAFAKNGKLINAPINYLITRLQDQNWVRWPVIDETGIQGYLDIKLPPSGSLNELNDSLKDYGIVFSLEKRKTKMVQANKRSNNL